MANQSTVVRLTLRRSHHPGLPQSLDAPQIYINWYNTNTENYGPVRIGMITLSENATGDWILHANGYSQESGQFYLEYIGDVVNGAMMPEPASLGLLGLSGLALLHRR